MLSVNIVPLDNRFGRAFELRWRSDKRMRSILCDDFSQVIDWLCAARRISPEFKVEIV